MARQDCRWNGTKTVFLRAISALSRGQLFGQKRRQKRTGYDTKATKKAPWKPGCLEDMECGLSLFGQHLAHGAVAHADKVEARTLGADPAAVDRVDALHRHTRGDNG